MANQPGCYSVLDFCAIRASRLTADGTPDYDEEFGSAEDNSPISLGRTAQVTTGDRFERKNGCGVVCSVKENPDTTTGETLSLSLCNLNIELIELLTGATVILDPADPNVIIGFIVPDPTAVQPSIELNGWSKTWDADSQVADPYSYTRFVWPLTTWRIADWTLQNGFLDVTLEGKASGNSNISDGSFSDHPAAITEYFGLFFDEAANVPDGCGYLATPVNAAS
jgi:hypothetical protein